MKFTKYTPEMFKPYLKEKYTPDEKLKIAQLKKKTDLATISRQRGVDLVEEPAPKGGKTVAVGEERFDWGRETKNAIRGAQAVPNVGNAISSLQSFIGSSIASRPPTAPALPPPPPPPPSPPSSPPLPSTSAGISTLPDSTLTAAEQTKKLMTSDYEKEVIEKYIKDNPLPKIVKDDTSVGDSTTGNSIDFANLKYKVKTLLSKYEDQQEVSLPNLHFKNNKQPLTENVYIFLKDAYKEFGKLHTFVLSLDRDLLNEKAQSIHASDYEASKAKVLEPIKGELAGIKSDTIIAKIEEPDQDGSGLAQLPSEESIPKFTGNLTASKSPIRGVLQFGRFYIKKAALEKGELKIVNSSKKEVHSQTITPGLAYLIGHRGIKRMLEEKVTPSDAREFKNLIKAAQIDVNPSVKKSVKYKFVNEQMKGYGKKDIKLSDSPKTIKPQVISGKGTKEAKPKKIDTSKFEKPTKDLFNLIERNLQAIKIGNGNSKIFNDIKEATETLVHNGRITKQKQINILLTAKKFKREAGKSASSASALNKGKGRYTSNAKALSAPALSGSGVISTLTSKLGKITRHHPRARPGFPGEKHLILPVEDESGHRIWVTANYAGPGTHYKERAARGDPPVDGPNGLDAVSQRHDAAYEQFYGNPKEIRKADLRFIAETKDSTAPDWLKRAAIAAFIAKIQAEDRGITVYEGYTGSK